MKTVMVISDNPVLMCFFKNECGYQKLDNALIDYRYSVKNPDPSEMVALGATPLDLKDPRTCAWVQEHCSLVLSIHCRQVFPAELVRAVTCINVHPGYNPWNRGWYPQVFSILNGKPAGATIHLMDEFIDHGPIIDQIRVEVRMSDTSLQVYGRILEAEKLLIKNNLRSIVEGTFESKEPLPDEGNYNSVTDFRNLCCLDLNAMAPVGDTINLLRALSHGEHRNAYFHDEFGRKVFVRLLLAEDS